VCTAHTWHVTLACGKRLKVARATQSNLSEALGYLSLSLTYTLSPARATPTLRLASVRTYVRGLMRMSTGDVAEKQLNNYIMPVPLFSHGWSDRKEPMPWNQDQSEGRACDGSVFSLATTPFLWISTKEVRAWLPRSYQSIDERNANVHAHIEGTRDQMGDGLITRPWKMLLPFKALLSTFGKSVLTRYQVPPQVLRFFFFFSTLC
jgi:hypothetical protein